MEGWIRAISEPSLNSSPSETFGLWRRSVDAISKVEDTAVRDALMFGLDRDHPKFEQDVPREGERQSIANGTYYIPQVFREMVVTNGFDYKVETQLIPAFEELAELMPGDICISTQSATNLQRSRPTRSTTSSPIRPMPRRSSTAS